MLTENALFNTLLQELNDIGLPGISATLDKMYRSPEFVEMDPLAAIAALVTTKSTHLSPTKLSDLACMSLVTEYETPF